MNVNVVPKKMTTDLWTVNTDDIQKLYGTIPLVEEENASTDPKQDAVVTESNSSADLSETESLNASSEADTSGLIFTKQSSFRKSIKIGPRNRKFSNSLREQIEGPDSSDCDDKQCKLEPIESKQNLVYSCEESSSLNSYKSSRNDEEEEEDEEISLSSETLSDDLKEDMKNLSLFDNFPN
uniref:Uncharacterized protein n=4 Tax=Rhodnius TaxID=13248 RepID=T1IGM6_RHOPR